MLDGKTWLLWARGSGVVRWLVEKNMLEVTEVAPEMVVNLLCRDWAEPWGMKIKSLRRFSQFTCYQQDVLAGNSVCIRATKLALVSLSRCHHEWILLGPG